jgi:transcriptional regulator GlxA family with amidase domain
VYRIFAETGQGVASYIRYRRLDRCRTDLIERPDLSVAAICERWGAGDPKHFARKYRARFGEGPGETRLHAAPLTP